MRDPRSCIISTTLVLILLLMGSAPVIGQDRIPLDTLEFEDISDQNQGFSVDRGGDDSSEDALDTLGKWMFWDRDLSLSRFPDSLPPGNKLGLPIDPDEWEGVEPKGIGCLAMRLYVPDSSVGRRLLIQVRQFGACEIHVDGEKLGGIGKVGSPKKEERRYARLLDPYQHVFRESGEHLILIRFSDQQFRKERKRYADRAYGPSNVFMKRMRKGSSSIHLLDVMKWFGALVGFLFALGVIHFLIFLFYPRKRSNLYYVLFIWTFAFLILYSIQGVTENPVHQLREGTVWVYALHIFSFSLLTMLYAFLRRKGFGWIYAGLLGGGVLLILSCELGWIGDGVVHSLLWLPLLYIESLRVIIVSMYRRDPGSWILGLGGGLFIGSPIVLFMLGAIIQDFSVSGFQGLLVLGTWFMSIPLSMSVYLAHDFATTSKGLERKLEEVEELNERNLEQEREKQRILEEKKEELEEKVKERTAELQQRKEEVEEAHQEITDSIHYAQRIQEAVLPEETQYQELGEHFIFFRPRDPVSGDFHWGRKVGDHFFIAAVDCTGHGVPGAFMSMLGVSFLNEIVAAHPDISPGELLTRLKEKVVQELTGRSGTAKDGMDAAMLKVSVPAAETPNPKSKIPREEVEVQFAGANNPLYLVGKGVAEEGTFPKFQTLEKASEPATSRIKPFPKSSDGIEVKGDKGAIGHEEHGVEAFTTISFKARKGDALYLFSDGYADQFGGPKGKKFRYGPFKRLLGELSEKPMEEQRSELERRFLEWKGEGEQVDDVLVIGVRV